MKKKKYIMKLTSNKCMACKKDVLIKKTELTFYCNTCKTRYKKQTPRSKLELDDQVKNFTIDKKYIHLKNKKTKYNSNKVNDNHKRDLWRKAKKETLKYYNIILNDDNIAIDRKNEISDMLILYNRFGSATEFTRKATELYKKYLLELSNNTNNES